MNLPIQSNPIFRGVSAVTAKAGVMPAGTNQQCCGSNCMTKYCLIGLSSKGCVDGKPYINCISPI
jgi:hypothetical protein